MLISAELVAVVAECLQFAANNNWLNGARAALKFILNSHLLHSMYKNSGEFALLFVLNALRGFRVALLIDTSKITKFFFSLCTFHMHACTIYSRRLFCLSRIRNLNNNKKVNCWIFPMNFFFAFVNRWFSFVKSLFTKHFEIPIGRLGLEQWLKRLAVNFVREMDRIRWIMNYRRMISFPYNNYNKSDINEK